VASGTSYNGWPATVLRYVAEQFNARVEPIIGGWCWGYTYKANVNNPSSLSCHASGTALDINAPDHPNGSGGTFTDSQRGEIYAILDECQGAVSWLEGYDEMHFEIQVDAADLAAVAASLPAGGGPPPNTTDWFDMATKDELAAVIWEQINRPEHLASVAITVWQHMINDRGDAAAQLASASQNAEWAAGGIAAIPTDVWTKTITNETAADLLARAGAG
jgi:hypothetical protein